MAAAKGVKVKCSGCQRKVEVPEGVLENFPDPDDDDDFLSGVPMVASGDEDILTEADLAIESKENQESADLVAKANLLDNDFEFSVADSASSVEAQEQEDDQEDDQSSANDGDDDSVDPETDVLLDDSQNESKTGGDEDLNQLLAGVADVSGPPVEKGSFGIRCSVCDSKLFVSVGQVGKEVLSLIHI